ncbi:polysaccharide pyruvyl transferase family protein [Klebsiella quasipneumoniae]|nr:polysaccharide pyruvyl transferase family protein [Klebsiella quasipneumoniae]
MTTYLTLLKICGVKFLRTGVSVGPLNTGYMFYERFLNKIVNFTGVRENKSIKYLAENDITRNIKKVKDLAFWSLNKEKLKLNQNQKYIAYSFRSFDSKIDDKMVKRIAVILEKTHAKFKSDGVNCKLISVTQVQRDLDFNTKIKEELISLNPTIEVEDYFYNISKESYIELKNIYSETDIIFLIDCMLCYTRLNQGHIPLQWVMLSKISR